MDKKRMHPILRIFLFLTAGMLSAPLCWGADLAIRSRTTLSFSAGRIRVQVHAENIGGEPACEVRASLYMFGRRCSAGSADRLDVNQSRTFTCELSLPPGKKGEFAFVGEVLYRDGNRRPSAALSAGTFRPEPSGGDLLSGWAPEIALTAGGRLPVTIRSRSAKPLDAAAALYLPPSLTTPQKEKRIALKPHETAAVDFPLQIRYGGDAVYPVVCIVTAEDGAETSAAVIQTLIRINDARNWFFRTRWHWLGVGGLILLAWARVAFGAGKKRIKQRLKESEKESGAGGRKKKAEGEQHAAERVRSG